MEGKITVRRNPIRTTKRSRFLDKNVRTLPSTVQKSVPLPVLTSSTDPTTVSTSKCDLPHVEIAPKISKGPHPDALTSKSVPVSVSAKKSVLVSKSSKSFPTSSTTLKIDQKSGSMSTVSTKPKSRKSNKFIRFRFQIDCTEAVDLDVDELVGFLKSDMKIDGQKKNLSDVAIERRNANVNILAKVMVKKKYLKLLAKKFLHKKKIFNYRVETKNKRTYKIVPKAGPSTVPK